MTTTIIDLQEADADRRDSYGITHEGVVRHTVTGQGLHARGYPHRVQVWDNTGRPNPHPGETRRTQYGWYGGDGRYLDPHNQGTDATTTVYLASESIALLAHYTAEDIAHAREGEPLAVGQRVRLRYPAGRLSGEYTIAARPLADPELEPAPPVLHETDPAYAKAYAEATRKALGEPDSKFRQDNRWAAWIDWRRAQGCQTYGDAVAADYADAEADTSGGA